MIGPWGATEQEQDLLLALQERNTLLKAAIEHIRALTKTAQKTKAHIEAARFVEILDARWGK